MPKLTKVSVENARPTSERREVSDAYLPGLYLVIQPSGARSWAVRYRFGGKPAKHTIGSYPAVSLAAAREIGGKALRAVAEGRDPRQDKKAAERAASAALAAGRDTFESVAKQFLDRYAKKNTREASWRETARILGFKPDPDNAAKWIATNDGVAAKWGRRSIHDITRRDVLDLLDAYVDRGSPVMANRALAAVRKMFSWAASRDIVSSSPCVGVARPSNETSRDRVLADDELRLIWKASEKIDWPFGPLVKLLMLTLQRRDEVGEIRRSELDTAAKLWTIPRERVKNDQAHEVPLSDAALAILESLPTIGKARDGFVFTTSGDGPVAGYSRAKERLDCEIIKLRQEEATRRREDPAKVKPLDHWTFHDLRRTGASGMARLGINLPVIEKVLNHTSGSFRGVAGVYQRHSFAEEKRSALQAWGRFVESLVNEPYANVIALHGVRP